MKETVWVSEWDGERGEVTCSHKDGTQQHQHRTAAKNKHCLKASQTKRTGDPPLPPLWVHWRMYNSSSLQHLFSQSLLTSAWRIVGEGVLRYTPLHYVSLGSQREQMTKAGVSISSLLLSTKYNQFAWWQTNEQTISLWWKQILLAYVIRLPSSE